MIGKITNGAFISPSLDERKKIVIANPTDEQLKFVMGYKDVIADEEPELTDEKQYLIPVYEDAGEIILQHWEIGEYDAEGVGDDSAIIIDNGSKENSNSEETGLEEPVVIDDERSSLPSITLEEEIDPEQLEDEYFGLEGPNLEGEYLNPEEPSLEEEI